MPFVLKAMKMMGSKDNMSYDCHQNLNHSSIVIQFYFEELVFSKDYIFKSCYETWKLIGTSAG